MFVARRTGVSNVRMLCRPLALALTLALALVLLLLIDCTLVSTRLWWHSQHRMRQFLGDVRSPNSVEGRLICYNAMFIVTTGIFSPVGDRRGSLMILVLR